MLLSLTQNVSFYIKLIVSHIAIQNFRSNVSKMASSRFKDVSEDHMTSLRNSRPANQILAKFKHAKFYNHSENPNHKISRGLTCDNKNTRIW